MHAASHTPIPHPHRRITPANIRPFDRDIHSRAHDQIAPMTHQFHCSFNRQGCQPRARALGSLAPTITCSFTGQDRQSRARTHGGLAPEKSLLPFTLL